MLLMWVPQKVDFTRRCYLPTTSFELRIDFFLYWLPNQASGLQPRGEAMYLCHLKLSARQWTQLHRQDFELGTPSPLSAPITVTHILPGRDTGCFDMYQAALQGRDFHWLSDVLLHVEVQAFPEYLTIIWEPVTEMDISRKYSFLKWNQ